MERILIHTEFIKLDALLKLAGMVETEMCIRDSVGAAHNGRVHTLPQHRTAAVAADQPTHAGAHLLQCAVQRLSLIHIF